MHLELLIGGFSNVTWDEDNFVEMPYALKYILIELKIECPNNFNMKELRNADVCICSEFRGL